MSSPPSAAQHLPVLIEAKHLSRVAASGSPPLLAPTDFSLCAGERVAVSGNSGSGKSVLLRLLALLDAPSTGEVRWMNSAIAAQSIPHYRSCVCYLAQRPALVEGSVMDNLQMPFRLKSLRHRRLDSRVLDELLGQAEKPQGFLDKLATDLSGGEAQLVALIRVLLLEPQVILFDEPTSALDPRSAAAVERLVMNWFNTARHSRAYIWVSHDREQALRMCTRQMSMRQGVLCENIT